MDSNQSVEAKALGISIILANIISYLPDRDLFRMRGVNKAWNNHILTCVAEAMPRRKIWIRVNAKNLMTNDMDLIRVDVENVTIYLNYPSSKVDDFWSAMYTFFDRFHEDVIRIKVKNTKDEIRIIPFHKIWNTFDLPNLRMCYIRQRVSQSVSLLPKQSVRKIHLKRPTLQLIESVLKGCPNLQRLETMNRHFTADFVRASLLMMRN